MNTKLLTQAISGVIPGGISAEDFAVIISTDKNTAEKILDLLTQNGIGQTIGNLVNFEDGDKLKTALFAKKMAYLLRKFHGILIGKILKDW